MKEYMINKKDYLFGVNGLIDSVFSVLPLYEDKNEHLESYVEDLIEEFAEFKKLTNNFPIFENENWYLKVILNLQSLKSNILIENNHKKVKRKTLFVTNTLEKHLKKLGEKNVI